MESCYANIVSIQHYIKNVCMQLINKLHSKAENMTITQ